MSLFPFSSPKTARYAIIASCVSLVLLLTILKFLTMGITQLSLTLSRKNHKAWTNPIRHEEPRDREQIYLVFIHVYLDSQWERSSLYRELNGRYMDFTLQSPDKNKIMPVKIQKWIEISLSKLTDILRIRFARRCIPLVWWQVANTLIPKAGKSRLLF